MPLIAMGCEASRSVSVEDKNRQQKNGADERIALTDLQVDVIKSTWPIIAKDLTGNGAKLMIEVFTSEPAIRKVFTSFHFSSNNLDTLFEDSKFQQHSRRFMETVQLAAEHVEDNETDHSEVLMMLGAKHATIPGFDLMYLSTFTKCMHSTWENILGEEYTDDVRDAWATVFEYISSKIRDGYLIYMEDKENEKREQAATAGKAS